MKLYTFILFSFLLAYTSDAQQKPDSLTLVPVTTIDGESIPQLSIREVAVYSRPSFTRKKYVRRYNRLVRNVKKVYPYAKFIHVKIDEINNKLVYLDDEKEQKKYIKKVQKDMMDEFEDDVRHMTYSQGKILVKLIDRETGDTSYEWLKEMRGELFAGFWQTVARIFGNNLKAEFDPKGEDRYIENIVRMIDSGLI